MNQDEQPQENTDEAAAQQQGQQREEDPCADCCQLKEHKGYDTCERAGVCQYEQSFGGSPRG